MMHSVKSVKMADAAAVRREARRRRILQNSETRLQYISGKSDEGSIKAAPPSEVPAADLLSENTYPPEGSTLSTFPNLPQYNGVLFPDPELSELISSQTVAAGDHQVPRLNDLATFGAPTSEQVQERSILQKLIDYKYDIFILSLLIQLLNGLSIVTFDETYFFLPLVIYSITKSIWIPEDNKAGIANLLLLLNGVSAQRASKVLYVTQWFSILFKDASVYIFATVCVQSIYLYMKSYSVT